MKNCTALMSLCIILCSLVLWLTGCWYTQPGETAAEGHRRHLRNLRVENEQMMQDIDTVLHTDEPSSLNEKRLP